MKNTLIKVLSFVMALTMIVGCFTAVATAADCTHANATATVVAPTCADRGYTRHVCPDCNYVWQDNYVAKSTEHTELETKDATEATCTDPAYEASIVCKTCGTVVSAGEAVEDSEPILHTFTQKVVAATCEQKGYTTWICVNCGLTAEQCAAAERADKVEGNNNFINREQKYIDNTEDLEGVIGEIDYTDFKTKPNNEADVHHVWSYEIVKAIAPCQEGLVQRTCAACGTVEDIVIEAVHTGVALPSTYLALAMQGKYCGKYVTGMRCTTCGAYYETETVELVENTVTGHNWAEVTSLTAQLTYEADGITGRIDPITNKTFMAITGAMTSASELKKAPTCDAEGYKVVYCTVCGAIEKQTIEKAKHDFLGADMILNLVNVYDAEFDAAVTCVPALRAYKYCSNCDYVELWATLEEAVAHEIEVSEEASYAATCDTPGLTVTYCTLCYEWDETANGGLGALVPTEDVYYYDHDDDAATANKSNAYKVEVKTAALGHDMSDWSAFSTNCTEKATAALANAYIYGTTNKVAVGTSIGIHRTRACQNEDCEYAQVQIKVAKDDHVWPTDDEKAGTDGMVLVAGNCMVGSHYEWGCKTEGCAATDGVNIGGTTDDGAKVATNHVVVIETGRQYADNDTAAGAGFVTYTNNNGNMVASPVVPHLVDVKPTCKKAGQYQIQCSCGANITKTGLMLEHKWDTVYNKNTANGRGGDGDVSYEFKAATCTKDGQTAGVVCYDCGFVKVATTKLPKGSEVKSALVATSQDGGELVYTTTYICTGHTGTALAHATYKTDGNCQTKATTWVVYNCCGEKVVTEGDFGACDYTTNGTTSSAVDYKPSTCYKAGNHAYKTCRVCGEVVVTFCADNTINAETGLYPCGMTSEEHIIAKANNDYVIPAKEHDFEHGTLVDKVDETCFTNGYTAHYVCANANCDATYGKEVIPAHGNAYWVELAPALNINGLPLQTKTVGGVTKAMASVTTCTEDSVPAGSYCSKCLKDWTAQNYLLGEKSATNTKGYTNYAPFVVEADNDHDAAKMSVVKIVNYYTYADQLLADGVPAYAIPAEAYVTLAGGVYTIVDCTKDAYVIAQCGDCDEAFLVEAVHYTAKKAHNISNSYIVVDAAANELCLKDSVKYKACINCLHTQDYVVTKAKVAHKYTNNQGDEITIDLSCTKIADFHGKTCQICGYIVDATVPYGATAPANTLVTSHNVAYGYQAPTCTEDGFQIISCADCEKTLVNEELEALNPNHLIGNYCYNDKGELVECDNNDAAHEHDKVYTPLEYVKYVTEVGQVEATYTTPGYLEYVCKKCGETVKFYNQAVLTAPKLTFDVAENTVVAAGDKLAVNVYISGYEFAFNTLKFDIEHSAGLALAAENVVIDYAFAAEDNVTATAKQNDGYVSVSIIVPVDVATGAAKDVEITAAEAAFVTVYFDVLPNAVNAAITDAEVTDALSIEVSKAMSKAETQYEKDEIKADFVDSIEVAGGEFIEDFATAVAGDWDGNGVLDASDSVAIMTASYNADTNTVLDINKNGVVDLEDHVKFLNFYLSEQSIADYLELVGVDYNTYLAAVEVKVDLDKNQKIDENDKAIVAYNLVQDLADISYYMLSYVTVEDVIDDIIADLIDNGLRDGSNHNPI